MITVAHFEGLYNSLRKMCEEKKYLDVWLDLYALMVKNQQRMLAGGLYDECILTRVPPKFAQHCNADNCEDCEMLKAQNAPRCIPWDVPQIAAYNILHLTSEVSEILQSDKRWKSIRKNHVDKQNKLEEIADCFICLFNIAIWSGFEAQELLDAIIAKSNTYTERIKDEVGKRK